MNGSMPVRSMKRNALCYDNKTISPYLCLILLATVMGFQCRLFLLATQGDELSTKTHLVQDVPSHREDSMKMFSNSLIFYFTSYNDWKHLRKNWYGAQNVLQRFDGKSRRKIDDSDDRHHYKEKLDNTGKKSYIRYFEECEELSDWQHYSFPTCNSIHEIDFTSFHDLSNEEAIYLGHGGVRGVWELARHSSGSTNLKSESVAVIKTLKWEKGFEPRYYSMHNIDALAMERLTESSNIVDIYAFCGMSAINEIASRSLRGLLREKMSMKGDKFLYNTARSIIESVSDVHQIDGPESMPSLLHGDIGPSNFVVFTKQNKTIIKLNDFNGARLVKRDPSTFESCGYKKNSCASVGGAQQRVDVRSPDECLGKEIVEKHDIWGIGVMLFFILTQQRPFYFDNNNGMRLTNSEIRDRIMKGVQPSLPEVITNSTKPVVVGLVNMMKRAFALNSAERPSAQDLLRDLNAIKVIVDDSYN